MTDTPPPKAPPNRWSVGPARAAQRVLDVVVLVGALWLACLLRFDFNIPTGEAISTLVQTPIVVVVQLAALGWFGVNQFIWRYVGLAEMAAFVKDEMVRWQKVIQSAKVTLQ